MPIGMTRANAPPRPAAEHPTIRALITPQKNVRAARARWRWGWPAAVTRRGLPTGQLPQEGRH